MFKSLFSATRAALAVCLLVASFIAPYPAHAAAGTWTMYANAKLSVWGAGHNIGTDTYVAVLLTASYTPVTNTHATWADISAFEVSACTGYTAGGQTATLAKALSTGTVAITLTALSWPGLTCTQKYVAIVRRAGGSLVSGDRLLTLLDLDTASGSATVSTVAGTLGVTASPNLFSQ